MITVSAPLIAPAPACPVTRFTVAPVTVGMWTVVSRSLRSADRNTTTCVHSRYICTVCALGHHLALRTGSYDRTSCRHQIALPTGQGSKTVGAGVYVHTALTLVDRLASFFTVLSRSPTRSFLRSVWPKSILMPPEGKIPKTLDKDLQVYIIHQQISIVNVRS